jgi:peptidoglycan hydrolase-like protein with peptidoglycan-binding domain
LVKKDKKDKNKKQRMILKIGSRGKEVKELQEFLEIGADGVFGSGTESAVKKWQSENGLGSDGIVGPATWDAMGIATTDNSEKIYETENGLIVNRHLLPVGEYKQGPTNKEYVFIHHTAGWHNPYNCIDQWARDTRGAVATEFVLGGPSVKGNDTKYDGEMVQCIPEGGYGWHLGKNGSRHMHTHSVGIEVCNFGWVKNGKTYAGTRVHESQLVTLDQEFRGHKTWHRYSDTQIESLRKWILWVGERDSIDVRKGLPESIKKIGVSAFEFNEDAYYGRIKGLWTHTNTRKDKVDMFPQKELVDMLVSL